MIRLDFDKFCEDNHDSKKYGYSRKNRDYWKAFICEWHKKRPELIKKSPNGNGTHTDIGSVHVQATGGYSLYLAGEGVSFAINYYTINTVDIDEANRLIIFNEILAIKY